MGLLKEETNLTKEALGWNFKKPILEAFLRTSDNDTSLWYN